MPLVGLVAVGYLWVAAGLSFEAVAQQEIEMRAYQQAHPGLVYGVAFLCYVAVAGISLPGVSVLTIVCGWLFGFLPGLLLVSFASTAGASLAFLLSRHALRRVIQSWYPERLRMFLGALARDGALYLFGLRLIPAVPYTGVNLVMGMTQIGLWTFWWVSQLGMLPATAVYVSVGAMAPDLRTVSERGITGILSPELLGALTIMGLFPLLVKLAIRRAGMNQPTLSSMRGSQRGSGS